MKRSLTFSLIFLGIILLLTACGGPSTDTKNTEAQAATESSQSTETAVEAKGEAVATEILTTYDAAVAEIATLMAEKPEATDLKPQIEAVFQKYGETMTALNTKYLALKDEDIALFGECNGYMGNNRGKHVFEKDNALVASMNYYNMEKEERELTKFINDGLFDLLEIAVKH